MKANTIYSIRCAILLLAAAIVAALYPTQSYQPDVIVYEDEHEIVIWNRTLNSNEVEVVCQHFATNKGPRFK